MARRKVRKGGKKRVVRRKRLARKLITER